MVIGQHLVKISLFIPKSRLPKRLDFFLEEKHWSSYGLEQPYGMGSGNE